MISASDFLGSRITFDHFQGEPQSPNANHCPLLQCWGSSRAWLGVIQVCITSPNNYLLTTHILPYLARFFHSPKKNWSTPDWMHWLWHHSWNPPTLLRGGGRGGRTFQSLSHLGVQDFLLERGDNPEKGGLM